MFACLLYMCTTMSCFLIAYKANHYYCCCYYCRVSDVLAIHRRKFHFFFFFCYTLFIKYKWHNTEDGCSLIDMNESISVRGKRSSVTSQYYYFVNAIKSGIFNIRQRKIFHSFAQPLSLTNSSMNNVYMYIRQ